MASVHDVAAAVLAEHGGPMSTMKLQKLVYYSQAWSLVWTDLPLFNEEIQAWAAGPVVFELYDKHRGKYTVTEWPKGNAAALNDRERDTITTVVRAYGPMSGQQLSQLTHRERPWLTARQGLSATDRSSRVIELFEMADYYGALDDDDEATPVDALSFD